jgi:hypothetical protein
MFKPFYCLASLAIAVVLLFGSAYAPAGEPQWLELQDVTHEVRDEQEAVCVQLSRTFFPEARVLTKKPPPRVFFDLKPVRSYSGKNRIEVGSDLVETIRIGWHREQFVRVVVDLKEGIPFETSWRLSVPGNRYCLQLEPK